jgi:hypothetical protein
VGLELVSLNTFLKAGAGQEGKGVLSFHMCCPTRVDLNFLFNFCEMVSNFLQTSNIVGTSSGLLQ